MTNHLLRLTSTFIAVLLLTNAAFLYSQGTGIPDSTFGKNGQVFTKIAANRDDISQSVALTPDNKIVIAGNSFNIIGYSNIAVVRYKTRGVRDKTFNGTGTRIINNAFCNVVAVQPDKKIVIGGSVAIGSNTVFGIWRLNSDGSNDSSFGTNGYQTVAFGGYVICFAMKLQNDGKILIGGNDGNFYAGNSSLILARLNSNGRLDKTFSGDGKFSLNLARKSLTCNEILVQPDGKIIAAGQLDTIVRPNFLNEFFATRLHSDGTIDVSFGNNGIVRAKNSFSDVAYCAGLLPDGRIVMGGFSKIIGSGNVASVLGLTANGIIDKTFGTNGWSYPSFYGATGILNAGIVQANGKIIFAGDVYNTNSTSSVGLVRLKGNGSLDLSFANKGLDTFFNSANALGCNDAALQSDGKILITGYQSQAYDAFFTARFLNDQQLRFAATNESFSSMSEANSAEANIVISPNPAKDFIVIKAIGINEGKKVITVFDNNGQVFLQQIVNGANIDVRVAVHTLTSGIYTCKIDAGKNVYSIKFLKE